jgi:integrase
MERVFKRTGGRVWYGWFYENGHRIQRSTRCRDKSAAEAVVRQWQRDAADPAHAAARTATLTNALQQLLRLDAEEIAAGRRSEATLDFHRKKAGHLVRVFETNERGELVPFPLVRLRPADVDGYISRRRAEEASDSTISKEIIVLRKALRLAIRAGLWRGRVEEVIPVGFSPQYEPRKRALTAAELSKLLAELSPPHAARVAFIVATSANWSESERARLEDVRPDHSAVFIRGTKRKTRLRTVPIVSPAQQSLLAYAMEHARPLRELLFTPWTNVRRTLLAACKRAKIERCSPNDLRRTFSNWQVEAGVPLFPIAQAMGHKDTRMLERVYGRQSPEQLAVLMARAMGLPPPRIAQEQPQPAPAPSVDCSTVAAESLDSAGFPGPDGLTGTDLLSDTESPKNSETPRTSQSSGLRMFERDVVPGPGIEPGTRGFSVPCSTD